KAADVFFIQLDTAPTLSASLLDAGQGLSLTANIGALQVGGQVLGLADPDGTRQPLLQASVSLGLAHDSQGQPTSNTLRSTPATSLFTVAAAGSLGLDIPIQASLQLSSGRTYDFSVGNPELTVVDADLFSAPPTVNYKNFDTLLSF